MIVESTLERFATFGGGTIFGLLLASYLYFIHPADRFSDRTLLRLIDFYQRELDRRKKK